MTEPAKLGGGSQADAPAGHDRRVPKRRQRQALGASHLPRWGSRWVWGGALALVTALGLVLLFLLAQANNNRQLYERYYTSLFILNVAVALVLMTVLAWVLLRLLVRRRQGRFGSRLLIKLAAIFALVGVVPGALIYVVSYQFVSRSIESWFDVKVENALTAGLNLGKVSIAALSDDLVHKTRTSAEQLSSVPDVRAAVELERIRLQLAATDILLWNGDGQLIAAAGESRFQLNPERPPAQTLRNLREVSILTQIENLDDDAPDKQSQAASVPTSAESPRIKVLAQVNPSGLRLTDEPRVLQVTQTLPPALVVNAMAVTAANREYQERALARGGLKRMYIGTLTLSLFLAVFGAVLLAVLLGNQLARPLLLLADGVRQVAAGDLTPKKVLQDKDELGGLTRSFADMTQQLFEARHTVEQSMMEVDAARAYSQTILDNLTAGVIVLSPDGVIESSNPGATRILHAPLAAYENRPLHDVPKLHDFATQVQMQFDAFEGTREQHGLDHWQQTMQLGDSANPMSTMAQDPALHLIVRGASLPEGTYLLVFDDVTEIVSAQRSQAWADVARRLAHEIKNPLTPIQLSAERLEMKLSNKVAEPERLILTKSVKTIVDQVDAMKRLVNEFRDYARLPAAELANMDLNSLITEVLHLYSDTAVNSRVEFVVHLDPNCPPIFGDAMQLRQVIHNLLQNAQDACEDLTSPHLTLTTQWLAPANRVRFLVQDNGPGFPEHILSRAFEPYVTTKLKGTGLGLAVVKKIADEHGARIDISNKVFSGAVQGAQVSLSFSVAT